MKLSTKGEYGILAVADLALHEQDSPLHLHEVAERQGIPKLYLDQLMLNLKKAGIVVSTRGPQGGYKLARPADTVTLLELVRTLEGPVGNINFGDKGSTKLRRLLKDVWDELSEHSADVLRNITLGDICAKYQSPKKKLLYYI